MDKPFKFILPSPNFEKKGGDIFKPKPHYLTPSGMSLLPREKQPPPMYGKHGATLPARFLKNHALEEQKFEASATLNSSGKQYCEPCEIELNSLEDLKRHRAQHEKCPVVGCLHKGHPSVMDKHINDLHTSGLFDKFKKLNTPEEIAAWREERRKRYPTLANVLLKQKAKEQRLRRGERLESQKSRFGKGNDRKRAQTNTREDRDDGIKKVDKSQNKRNLKNNKKIRKNRSCKKSENQELNPKTQNLKFDEEDEVSCPRIKMFTGTSQLQDYEHCIDRKNAVKNNALYRLVGMYGSDDEDEKSEENVSDNDDDIKIIESVNTMELNKLNNPNISEKYSEHSKDNGIRSDDENKNSISSVSKAKYVSNSLNFDCIEKDEHVSKNTCTSPQAKTINSMADEIIKNVISNQNNNSSDEAPEEIPIQRNTPDYSSKPPTTQKNSLENSEIKSYKQVEQTKVIKHAKGVSRKFGLDYRKARLRKQNTMLEKLLESDIRHERNVLLQCVRFVCENSFFNIGQNKDQEILGENKF